MGKVERFEDLRVWTDAMALAKGVRILCRDRLFRNDRLLAHQIWRASISVPSNIAEGFDRFSRKEFARFLTIAKGSCAEVRCQLRLASDVDLAPSAEVAPLLRQAESVSAMIGALRASLRGPKT